MALKDDRVEQSLRSCGIEFQMWGPKQEKVPELIFKNIMDNARKVLVVWCVLIDLTVAY